MGSNIDSIRPKPERAISFRQISTALAAPVDLMGLTRVDGYVVDAESEDVWGLAEKNSSAVQLKIWWLRCVPLTASTGKHVTEPNTFQAIATK
jgi:hypothetical protein